jgi:hypothetical protein
MSTVFKTSDIFDNINICNIKKTSFKKEFGGGEIFITNINNNKYVIKVIPDIINYNKQKIKQNVEYKKIIELYKINKKYLLFFSNIYLIKKCDSFRYYLMDYYEDVLEDFLINDKFNFKQYTSVFKQLLISLYILNNIANLYHNDIFKPIDGILKINTSKWNIKNVLLSNSNNIKKYYFFDDKITIDDYLIKIIDFQTLSNSMKSTSLKLKNIYFKNLKYVSEVFLCTFILLSMKNSLENSKDILEKIYKGIINNNDITSQKIFDEIFIKLIINILQLHP